MEILFAGVFTIALLIGWLHLSQRLQQLERRLLVLERRPAVAPPLAYPPEAMRPVAPPPPPPMPMSPPPAGAPAFTAPPAEPRATGWEAVPDVPVASATGSSAHPADWEAVLGGNLLNKLGMLLLVIGMALALGYSFTYMGPAGGISICLAASVAILVAGVIVEPRERYRIFARGLIGGGWAALYVTVYAMYSIEAARVVYDPFVAALLLMAVAAGMVVHSLRYRSETVSGLAYFVAYGTLAIIQVNTLSILSLAPLSASLLYVSRRFDWKRFGLLGAAATYITCALRGDTGTPLWQAQAVFAIYWLLFEAFDMLAGSSWVLAINAAGFLGLSLVKWGSTDPKHIWQFFAAASVAYLASAALRLRTGRWHAALALSAALAAGASLIKLDGQSLALALLAEAELLYVMGVSLRIPFLRYVSFGVFFLELSHIVIWSHAGPWASIAAITAAVFYLNRFLSPVDVFFGCIAAGVAALIAYERAPNQDFPLTWMLMAAVAFVAGRLRGLTDFLFQALGLAALALWGMLLRTEEPAYSLAIGAAVLFAAAVSTPQARAVHIAATGLLGLLLYRQVSGSVLTISWGAEGVLLLAAGFPLRDRILRLCGMGSLLVCILKLFLYDLSYLETLPRIFSFIVLGLILVGVSWLYTRFRERIQRMLAEP